MILPQSWTSPMAGILLAVSTSAADVPGFAWANVLWGGDDDGGLGFVVDAEGNSYVATHFYEPGTFGGITLDPGTPSGSVVYIAKQNAAGGLAWAQQVGSNVLCQGLALDSAGDILMVGLVFRNVSFGTTNFSVPSGTSHEAFVARFTSTGDLRWVREVRGPSSEANAVAVDTNGDAFVTGQFEETTSFGTTNLVSRGGGDIFIAAGSVSGSNALRGAISSGDLQDVIIVRYNRAGDLLWVRTGGGEKADVAERIALDRSGNVYVTGHFSGSFVLGREQLNSTNDLEQVFVAKLDRAGNVVFLKHPAGSRDNYGYGIGLDAKARCYIAGFFAEQIDFDGHPLAVPFVSAHHTFVACLETQKPSLSVERAGGQLN